MSESSCSIEMLGQKLSYPTTWHGTAAAPSVCVAISAITYMVRGWATPDTLTALRGIYDVFAPTLGALLAQRAGMA